jgi:CubicO group peptidase (beta-lactamase class C family)
MHDRIFAPLGMNGSSFTVPNSTARGVIPGGNPTATSWNQDLGAEAA